MCVWKGAKPGMADGYLISGQISGIDRTVPTVSSVTYSGTEGGGETMLQVVQGNSVYTTVLFSEAVVQVAASNSTARPKIVHQNGAAGTAIQYEIISSGLLTGGKCKEIGTGDDDGKIYECRLVTGASDTGEVRSYVAAFADAANNTGTAQTFDSVSGVTVIPAPVSGLGISTPISGGLIKRRRGRERADHLGCVCRAVSRRHRNGNG